jgi:predicted tellurium resistance membrane protein TerC
MQDKFPYILENLAHTPGIVEMIVGMIFAVAFLLTMWMVFYYGYGSILVWHDQREIRQKKETLTDLILMKDIQTELEKEIEQAMLKATFQG